MSSTEPVPETRDMSGDELSADDALLALRRYGRWPLVRDAFIRFRYGDGFSHARAFAFQLCLAVVPFMIALAGLAADLGARTAGQVLTDTIGAITPGASEPLVRELLADSARSRHAGEFGWPARRPKHAPLATERGEVMAPIEEALARFAAIVAQAEFPPEAEALAEGARPARSAPARWAG